MSTVPADPTRRRSNGRGSGTMSVVKKTAVSLPDDLFWSVDDLAKRQGMSRNELYAVALAEYLARHRDAAVTSKLNEVLADEPSDVDPALRAAQARSVGSGGLR